MATECSARTAIVEADEKTFELDRGDAARGRHRGAARARGRPRSRRRVRRRRAHDRPRRDPADGRASRAIPITASPPIRPTARCIDEIGDVKIDIAYAGSCTAGKIDDFVFYHQVAKEAVDAGLRVRRRREVLHPVRLAGGRELRARQRPRSTPSSAPASRVLNPGCGACIGCGPGVSRDRRPGDGQRDQPQLQGPLGPGQALARLAADRGGVGVHRDDHGLHAGDVPGDGGADAGLTPA